MSLFQNEWIFSFHCSGSDGEHSGYMIITILEISALILVAWPLLRLWHSRELAALFRKQQRWLAGVLLGWLLVVGILAVLFPAILHVLTPIVLSLGAALAWRSRVDFGKLRGLPPGSLSLTHSLAALTDRNHYLEQASMHGAIFKMSQFHKPVICIIGLETGFRLFREHRNAIGPSELPFNRVVTGGFLRYMDDQLHSRYAPLFMKALAMKNLASSTPRISAICQQTLSQLARDCGDSDSSAVAPGAYCKQLTFNALLLVLFGLSKEMPEYHEFVKAYSGLKPYPLSSAIPRKAQRSLQQLRQFLSTYTIGLPEPGPADQRSSTLREMQKIDPEMPDEVCIDNLLFILKIASDNVSSLLQWILKMLVDNPGWMELNRLDDDQPSTMGKNALADRVVDETLRLSQSEYLYRVLTKDVSFQGFTLPQGWLIRLCVWESHRSCPAFDQPEQFKPDRFAEREFSSSEYAPFGYGKHACNGAQLARLIAREFTRVLSSDFKLEAEADSSVAHDFRHWSHWRPGSNFKVKLTRQESAGHLTGNLKEQK
jgi:cytochrome P450